MHANFQASSFTCVGGEWSDGHMCDITPDPYTKFLNSPFALVGINNPFQLYNWSLPIFFREIGANRG